MSDQGTARPWVSPVHTTAADEAAGWATVAAFRSATPEKQCTDESAHGEHEWYDGPFRRECDGFVGRAGVPTVNSELTVPDTGGRDA